MFQNAFSMRLTRFNFNPYPMLVVDLMHEFEQGVWKNLFTHLTRILHASNPALVIEMDQRYASILQISVVYVILAMLQVPSGSQIWKCHSQVFSKCLRAEKNGRKGL